VTRIARTLDSADNFAQKGASLFAPVSVRWVSTSSFSEAFWMSSCSAGTTGGTRESGVAAFADFAPRDWPSGTRGLEPLREGGSGHTWSSLDVLESEPDD
jgi:hypothetical protein